MKIIKISTEYAISEEIKKGDKNRLVVLYVTKNEVGGTLCINTSIRQKEFIFQNSKPQTVKTIAKILIKASEL